ncbi:MAG: L-aspartate oxidase [Bacteroidetes bacterium]|nr:L-aspartate oxidase [Bacteroidota bacterium]
MSTRIHTDCLVIGTGVAGLSFALKAAVAGRQVLVITKKRREQSNTWWAQGGIAGVFGNNDSIEKHVQDTLTAGDGLCKEEVVRMVVSQGPERIRELMDLGTQFDRDAQGNLMLGREGGHSEHRILHNRDATGAEIARALLQAASQQPNIRITEDYFAIDLLTQHHLGRYVNRGHTDITCYGVYALDVNSQEVVTILSRVTVLASGGAGNVYAATTNPPVATGDGIAMALRAKARIANMEFYQFHPTALYDPGTRPAFLITEALRGKGAYLRSPHSKKRFMDKYDARLELAPRDIVARAIDSEMKQSGLPYVWLDATHLTPAELQAEFPTILETCRSKGIDLTQDYIPVRPAAHYLCGGIDVDTHGHSSIHQLFAIGECSHTGLHGANRLASNSLLEALVYAHTAWEACRQNIHTLPLQEDIPDWQARGTSRPEEWVLISHNIDEVQNIMSNYVGIVRTQLRLERAARRIELIYQETEAFYQRTSVSPELCELRNLIAIAYIIIKSAMLRHESRGLHYTLDYPEKMARSYDTVL